MATHSFCDVVDLTMHTLLPGHTNTSTPATLPDQLYYKRFGRNTAGMEHMLCPSRVLEGVRLPTKRCGGCYRIRSAQTPCSAGRTPAGLSRGERRGLRFTASAVAAVTGGGPDTC